MITAGEIECLEARVEALQSFKAQRLQALLLIGGLNEGKAPEAITADQFLLDTLRRSLGLLDNKRRYVRDVCALSAILRSSEKMLLSTAPVEMGGSPPKINRLLFACDAETAALRMGALPKWLVAALRTPSKYYC